MTQLTPEELAACRAAWKESYSENSEPEDWFVTGYAWGLSHARAAHDAEVRRKALGEVLAMWEAPYNGERFIDRLRRMANAKVTGAEGVRVD